MENKRFLQPFLLEELEIILRKKEQILQELNGQLRGMRGGSLHVKHRNGRVYYCEYAGGKEIGISKDVDKIYPKNTLSPENLKYATKSGRKMRSKSERTIGNRLEDRGIVYWYDSVLDLDGGVCSPDFWIRKDSGLFVIWEHLGLLGDPVYDKQNERKIEIYHGMGFREHTNLILTTEEDIENPGVLDGIIERFLLS